MKRQQQNIFQEDQKLSDGFEEQNFEDGEPEDDGSFNEVYVWGSKFT